MPVDSQRIADNLEALRGRIEAAATRARRSPDAVRLIAVTKTVGIGEVNALYDMGIRDFGENRVDHARDTIQAFDRPVCWHMIGSIQRRKARDVVELFDAVDSVDRVEVAEALDARCQGRDEPMPILVEVNVSGEESKHGLTPGDLPEALDRMGQLEHVRVDGLMTMAPWFDEPERTRPTFSGLRRLGEEFGLRELSMGMSNDFEVAIEEGATQVRVGTVLFA